MSFLHPPEELKKELVSIFTNNYPSYLTAVAALWPADVVAVPAFNDIFTGDAQKSKEIKSWPSLGIFSGDVFPTQTTQQRRNIFWHTQIYIRTFIRNSNPRLLETILDRHLQAQLLMFEDEPFNTINGTTSSFEFMRSEPTESILPLGSSQYIRGLETQWEAVHR